MSLPCRRKRLPGGSDGESRTVASEASHTVLHDPGYVDVKGTRSRTACKLAARNMRVPDEYGT